MDLKTQIEKYLSFLQMKRQDEGTIRNSRCRLKTFITFIGNKDVTTIAPEEIEDFFTSDFIKKLARGTYNHYISVLSCFFRYLSDFGRIQNNPTRFLKMVKEPEVIPEFFTLNEVRLLLKTDYPYHRKRKISNMRDKVLIHLAAFCGLRNSEAKNLKWSEINFEYGEIQVNQGKNLKDRLVPMPKMTIELLTSYRKLCKPSQDDFVIFGWRVGTSIDQKVLNEVFKRLCEHAGIKKVKPHYHLLRHTCATLYLRGRPNKRGMDIRVLKELMGHKDIGTTQKYAHVEKDLLRQEMKRCLPKI